MDIDKNICNFNCNYVKLYIRSQKEKGCYVCSTHTFFLKNKLLVDGNSFLEMNKNIFPEEMVVISRNYE